MPDVRLPDGTIVRNVPEGTTRSQLMARLQKAQPQKARGGIMGALENVMSSGNELLLGAGEGIYNAASAITDPIVGGAMNLISEGSGTRARESANKTRRRVVDAAERTFIPQANPIARTAGRIGGSIAVPLPKIAAAGKVAKGAARMVQGAVGGAAVREVDESALNPAAIGAVSNLVLPPVISKIAQTAPAQAVGRAVQRAMGGGADDVVAPLADDVADIFGRKAKARDARFKSLGVENPTTGMITRDPAAYSFEINKSKLVGVGDDLAQQMREVEETLVEKGRSLVRGLGGAKGPEGTGKAIEEVLEAKRTEMQQVTSKLYQEARETRGDELVGRLDGLRERMTDPDVVDNAAFDQMREGLIRRMTRLGAVGKDGSMSQPINVRQAEELRKFIGGLGSNMEPGVKHMRGQLINALDDDVVAVIGDDAFKSARASARAGFEEFKKTFPGKLADEKIAPEAVTRRILGDGTSLSDLRAMKKSMLSGTPEQAARGQEAWRGLQAQALDDLLTKGVDADGALNGSVLSREFNKAAPKLYEMLGPQDFKTLRRLAAATRDVKALPSGHSVNTSNTAVTLANLFDNAPTNIKTGWLGLLGKVGLRAGAHAGATVAAGPVGNIAVEGIRAAGGAAAAARAEQAVAEAIMQKIRLARDPQAAAAAIREAQEAAASSPALAGFLNSAGFGRVLGGSSASPR